VESSVASADSMLQTDHSSFKSSIEDQRNYVTDTVNSFTNSVQEVSDKLQQQSEDVDRFLSVELQQDIPTGICCSLLGYWSIMYSSFVNVVILLLMMQLLIALNETCSHYYYFQFLYNCPTFLSSLGWFPKGECLELLQRVFKKSDALLYA